MKKILFACLFLLSSRLFAMELVLDKTENTIRLYLLNTSQTEVLVNKRFAIGPSGGPSEVVLSFTDNEGKKYPFSAKIRLGPASEKDLILIGPNMLIGKEFNLGKLIHYYSLVPGTYNVKAKYSSTHEHSFGHLESNVLTIAIGTKR